MTGGWIDSAGFGGWLLRMTVEASALIVVILGLQAALRRLFPPRWRYALWMILVVRLALPWTPECSWSLYGLLPRTPAAARTSSNAAAPHGRVQPLEGEKYETGALGAAAPTAERVANPVTPWQHSQPEPGTEPGPANARQATDLPAARAARSHRVSSEYWVFAVWTLGALAVIGFAIAQAFGPSRAVGRRRFLTDQQTLELLEDCKEEMGIRAYLAVVETPRVTSPALFGFIRPRLLLPPGAIHSLGPERLRHVFLHELAHLRRLDIPVNWLLTALQAIHWFNPLVWYAFARLRLDRELACDALVLARTPRDESKEYARTIIHLLERFARPRRIPSLAGILEDHSQIRRRITMIANWKPVSRTASVLAAAVVAFLAFVAVPGAKNETAGKQPPAALPDLVVEDFTLNPYPEGKLYTVVVAIKNQGSKPAPAFEVHFLRDEAGKGPALIQGAVNSAGPLDPGKTWNEGSTPFALQEGVNELEVLLDPENKVPEADETNNRATVKVVVEGGRIVERSVSFQSYEDKVARLDIDKATLADVIALFGEPQKYVWGQTTFTRGNLPNTFIASYPKGFDVHISDGKIVELRFYEPWYAFRGKVRVGSTLDEVLAALGQPKETVTDGSLDFKYDVLYKDINGRKGFDYYNPYGANVRFFFQDDKVNAIYVTRGESAEAVPDPQAAASELFGGNVKIIQTFPVIRDCMVLAYMPEWRYGNVDNIAVANNDGGVRTLVAWGDIPKNLLENQARQVYVVLYSRDTTAAPSAGTVEVHELLADWPEKTAWNDQPKAAEKPVSVQPFLPGKGWKVFNMTDLVRAQEAASRPSFGVILRFTDENRKGNDWSGYAFVSREGSGPWEKALPFVAVVEPSQKSAAR